MADSLSLAIPELQLVAVSCPDSGRTNSNSSIVSYLSELYHLMVPKPRTVDMADRRAAHER